MTAQLRQVASMERHHGHTLTVDGLEIGVRIMFPYLLQPLQLEIYNRPHGEFAIKLKMAGQTSRDPKRGHGFVKLFYDRIEVPFTDWAAREENPSLNGEIHNISFSEETKRKLKRLCGNAHQEHLDRCCRELVLTARATWTAGSDSEQVSTLVRAAIKDDPMMSGEMMDGLSKWVWGMLQSTNHSAWFNSAI